MKKSLNIADITNELKGASLYFQKPEEAPDSPAANQSPAQPAPIENLGTIRTTEQVSTRTGEQTSNRTVERVNERTGEQTSKRVNEQMSNRTVEQVNERTDEQTSKRTSEPTNERPSERKPEVRQKVRYSFQIYDDQIIRLHEVKFRQRQKGIKTNLSQLVRNAIDRYLESE